MNFDDLMLYEAGEKVWAVGYKEDWKPDPVEHAWNLCGDSLNTEYFSLSYPKLIVLISVKGVSIRVDTAPKEVENRFIPILSRKIRPPGTPPIVHSPAAWSTKTPWFFEYPEGWNPNWPTEKKWPSVNFRATEDEPQESKVSLNQRNASELLRWFSYGLLQLEGLRVRGALEQLS